MITLITGLVGSKYGKYVLEIALVAGLIFGAYKWAEDRGKKVQKDRDDQAHSVEIEKSRKESSDLKDRLVAQANDKATAAEANAAGARAQFAQLAGVLATLDARSTQGREQVSKLADSELHADIVSKLGLRRANDLTPGYSAQEERSIDNTVTQYPIELDKNKTLAAQVGRKDAEAKANKDAADARQQAFQADEAYILLLSKYYVDIWNQHAPHRREAKCLYLWGCGRATINIDPPKKGTAGGSKD